MNLDDLLADEAFDLPVPADAVSAVHRRSARLRLRRNVLVLTPAVALLTGVGAWSALGSGAQNASVEYGATPTASPTPPPLPYQDPKQAFRFSCIEHDTKGVVDPGAGLLDDTIVTGDPVADCARLGRDTGFQVPLKAYYSGTAYLTVVPASWTLPDSLPGTYRPLPAGWKADPKRYTLNLMLTDEIVGLAVRPSTCRTRDHTVSLVQSLVAKAGLDYEIEDFTDRPRADGKTTCGVAYLPPEQGEVVRVGSIESRVLASGTPESATGLFIRDLRNRFGECLTLSEAKQAVADAGAGHGQADGRDYEVLETSIAGDRCTGINFVFTGRRAATIILRQAR